MATKRITVAEYLDQAINMSGKSQKEIAEEMGYDKPNIITMFKQAKTRLPINKVGIAAEALGVDPVNLMRLAMMEYMPETWDVLEQLFGNDLISEEEREVITIMRDTAGGQSVKPETEDEINELKNLVRGWKKRTEAHADAARRRIAALPKNKRGS